MNKAALRKIRQLHSSEIETLWGALLDAPWRQRLKIAWKILKGRAGQRKTQPRRAKEI